ncbi:hypothetical protein [Shinella sp. JR1-6]|uniref:hypothetical protein n=1 Tax=Shinella sp. JR1-6 TaxID=2527671 RepID=UPI001FDFBE04|nr:hypothetical protein [Shinella sp. JR1-6]
MRQWAEKKERVFTLADLERYLVLCAELVDEYGPVMQPWLDRFEMEYEKAKQPPPPKQVDRIRAKLVAEKGRDAAIGGTIASPPLPEQQVRGRHQISSYQIRPFLRHLPPAA